MKKQWNKDIHDRLKDFPKKAPEGLLNDIQSEMLRRGLSVAPIANKRPAIILRIASVAAMILLLLGISYLFHWQKPSALPDGQGSLTSPIVAETLPTAEEEKEMLSSTPANPTVVQWTAQTTSTPVAPPDSVHTKEETLTEDTTQEEVPSKEETESPQQAQPATERTGEVSKQAKWTYTPSRKKEYSFDVSIHYSGLLALDMSLGGDYDADINMSSPGVENPGDGTGGKDSTATASRSVGRTFKRYKHGEEAKHHIPVKLGVSFRYYLNDRWSIQSGLTYSYLASDLSYNSIATSYETKQKLHYIGIPIQAGLRIWEGKRSRSYISAGGQVEKLISGKAITHYTLDKQFSGTLIENISDNKLLFSALASIGIEYMLGKDLSLYAEPGIHYYFKNGNGLNTHYNEQPLNFNITVGFRFHWNK